MAAGAASDGRADWCWRGRYLSGVRAARSRVACLPRSGGGRALIGSRKQCAPASTGRPPASPLPFWAPSPVFPPLPSAPRPVPGHPVAPARRRQPALPPCASYSGTSAAHWLFAPPLSGSDCSFSPSQPSASQTSPPPRGRPRPGHRRAGGHHHAPAASVALSLYGISPRPSLAPPHGGGPRGVTPPPAQLSPCHRPLPSRTPVGRPANTACFSHARMHAGPHTVRVLSCSARHPAATLPSPARAWLSTPRPAPRAGTCRPFTPYVTPLPPPPSVHPSGVPTSVRASVCAEVRRLYCRR